MPQLVAMELECRDVGRLTGREGACQRFREVVEAFRAWKERAKRTFQHQNGSRHATRTRGGMKFFRTRRADRLRYNVSRSAINLWHSDRISEDGFPATAAFHRLRRTERLLAEEVLFAAQLHEPVTARSGFGTPGMWLRHGGLLVRIRCIKGASVSRKPKKHGDFLSS